MKFIHYSILIFSLIVFSCTRIIEEEEINGKIPADLIKTISNQEYIAKEENGLIVKEYLLEKSETVFDLNGNKIEERLYDRETKSILHYILFKYNSKKQITEESTYLPDDKIAYKIIYEYDFNGRKIEEKHFDLIVEGLRIRYVFSYNQNGDKIEENHFAEDGTWLRKYNYSLDSKRNVIEKKYYYLPDSLAWRASYKYDLQQRLIEENIFDMHNRLSILVTNKYDDRGNIIEWQEFHPMYPILDKTLIYTYNIFDKHENWLLRKTYNKEKLIAVLEREIDYH